MAIACLREVTFLPDRPDRKEPRFISPMLLSTFWLAFLPYFLLERFFDDFLRLEEAFLLDFLPTLFLLDEVLRIAIESVPSLGTCR